MLCWQRFFGKSKNALQPKLQGTYIQPVVNPLTNLHEDNRYI